MNGGRTDLAHVRFISAGAGSGKTYRLTEELEQALSEGKATPEAVIGTTFTVRAAAELYDRVRTRLIESGRPLLSEQMAQALVGTVHSVCGRLLARFAFELGLSPEINVASAEDGARLFNQALDEVLSADRVREMNLCAERLGRVDDREGTGWQDDVRKIAKQTRSNDIDPGALPGMGRESADRFLDYFPEAACNDEAREALLSAVQEAIANIDLASDTTKTTRGYVDNFPAPRLNFGARTASGRSGSRSASGRRRKEARGPPCRCAHQPPVMTATRGSMPTYANTSRASLQLQARPLTVFKA